MNISSSMSPYCKTCDVYWKTDDFEKHEIIAGFGCMTRVCKLCSGNNMHVDSLRRFDLQYLHECGVYCNNIYCTCHNGPFKDTIQMSDSDLVHIYKHAKKMLMRHQKMKETTK